MSMERIHCVVLLVLLGLWNCHAQDPCFSVDAGKNAITGLIPGNEASDPPNYWYFGKFEGEDGVEKCRQECAKEPLCWAYAHHLAGATETWRHRCYGRSNKYSTWTDNANLVSGRREPCSEVCMGDPSLNGNAVYRLIDSPRQEDRPRTFYFGDWYSEFATEELGRESCRLACAAERMCWAYSFFTESYGDEAWRGHCYGAGSEIYEEIVADSNIISGARVTCRERCFSTTYDIDPMKGLVSSPGSSNPPISFYFGDFGEDSNRCEARCQQEPGCDGFVHYLPDYAEAAWRGGCYGRDNTTSGHHVAQGTVGGRHRPCEEVCFHKRSNRNPVKGLLPSPGYQDPPNVFFFGSHFADDYDSCANACAFTYGCDAYALFSPSYPDSAYRGHCYGRGLQTELDLEEEHVYGGVRRNCQILCMDEETDRSTVAGLVSEPKQDNRPVTFYFGDFHDDVNRCKRACMLEPECYSYTLFTNKHLDPKWRGLCYGRNLFNQVNDHEDHAISGYQHSCAPVCMDRVNDRNTVHYLVGVGTHLRPYTFYFGDFGSNVERCEHACLMEPLCHSYTLHLRELGGPFAGLCYGRSVSYDTAVTELLHVSGMKEPCTEKCFDFRTNRNTVGNLVARPDGCDPPKTMCFSQMQNEEQCRVACYADQNCASYTYFTEFYEDKLWRGQCVGRNMEEEPESTETGVISGKTRACTQVCYDYAVGRSTVHGLVGGPPEEDRPRIFYFGHVGDDADKCRRMCEVQRDCFSYSLHFLNHTDSAWRGQCYGRSSVDWVDVEEENVVSGVRKPCGPVSYDVEPRRNTVHGLVDYPGHEYRPDVMYLGNFGDDLVKCRLACAGEPLCHSYSLHLPEFGEEWGGVCYGRSSFSPTQVEEDNVISGVKVPAAPSCMTEELNINTIHSLVPTVGWENRPFVFYFGLYGDDVARCRQACAGEPRCHTWTLHFANLSNPYAGHCYGRGSFNVTREHELNTISGTKFPCDNVCFDRYENQNSMYFLISQPGQDNLPHVFYFGYFENDVDRCEAACAAHPSCYAWLLHLKELNSPWSGHCYGRDAFHDVLAPEQHTVSGVRKPCQKVCFDKREKTNTVWGIIDQAEFEDRPRTFYFGNFGDDEDRCRRACEVEPYCESYSLHLTSYPEPSWRGQCYGRGNFDDVAVSEDHVTSGVKQPCTKTCFSEMEGHNTVWGLVESAGLDEGRPDVMFLGKYNDDVDRCRQACALEPSCVSYSLHLTSHEAAEWRGSCYGRTEAYDVDVEEEGVVSGYRKGCTGLSGGAIFGIVLGVLVLVAIVAFIVAAVLRGRREGQTPTQAIGESVSSVGGAISGGFAAIRDKVGGSSAGGSSTGGSAAAAPKPADGFDNQNYMGSDDIAANTAGNTAAKEAVNAYDSVA